MANVRQAKDVLARRWHDFDVLATAFFGRPPTKNARIPASGETADRANFVIAVAYLHVLGKVDEVTSAAQVFEMLETEILLALGEIAPVAVAKKMAQDERAAAERMASDIEGR